MATFLDVSGLTQFSNVFIFVLVLLIVYAILKTTKILGDNDAINLVVSFVVGLLVLLSPIATGIINLIAPWFAVIFILIIFSSIAFRVMGVNTAQVLGSNSLKLLLGVVIVLVIIVGSLMYIRQETSLPGNNDSIDEDDYTRPTSVLFHPQVLGGIIILLVAVFTIALMAGKPK
jgi:hypothetical protein